MPGSTRSAASTGAAHRQFLRVDAPHATQVVDARLHHVPVETRPLGDVVQTAGTVGEGRHDGAQRTRLRRGPTHQNNLPIWKTATALTQAVTSCMQMPKTVHLRPISRFWAASVATQGV